MAAADAAITSCDFKPISLGIRAKGYGFKAALMASKEPSPRLHPIAPITPTFSSPNLLATKLYKPKIYTAESLFDHSCRNCKILSFSALFTKAPQL
jgi:hypothetical protein